VTMLINDLYADGTSLAAAAFTDTGTPLTTVTFVAGCLVVAQDEPPQTAASVDIATTTTKSLFDEEKRFVMGGFLSSCSGWVDDAIRFVEVLSWE
jgi:hypothetical protein